MKWQPSLWRAGSAHRTPSHSKGTDAGARGLEHARGSTTPLQIWQIFDGRFPIRAYVWAGSVTFFVLTRPRRVPANQRQPVPAAADGPTDEERSVGESGKLARVQL